MLTISADSQVLPEGGNEMGNSVIIALLVVVIAVAVYSTVRRIRYGSSCCGEKDPAPKKIKVADRNRDHYEFSYLLNVEGMHCSNCAVRIENAFNEGGQRWAKADVGKAEVELLSKREETEEELCRIVDSAGFTLLSFKKY